jgi:NADH:ubiquinone oxidoreductase subunit 6 (subunit J)
MLHYYQLFFYGQIYCFDDIAGGKTVILQNDPVHHIFCFFCKLLFISVIFYMCYSALRLMIFRQTQGFQ